MNIAVLALDGLFDLGLAALLDTLTLANELSGMLAQPVAAFNTTLVGVQTKVKTAQGLGVPVTLAHQHPRPDVVLVPALGVKMPVAVQQALGSRSIAQAQGVLREWSQDKAQIAAACSGTLVVAGSHLLDGQQATTSWWLAPLFRQLYPRVTLDDSKMIVASNHFVTAGAALAHMDLALYLVRQRSPQLAALCARYLLVETRPSQAAFVIPDHLQHNDPMVIRFEQWVRQHLGQPFTLQACASSIGASERTLARKVRSVLGKAPWAYVQDVRAEQACHLLQTTTNSLDSIASQIGYADSVSLRALLWRKRGRSVRELRQNAEIQELGMVATRSTAHRGACPAVQP